MPSVIASSVPSPEMVAAAPKEGLLKPAVAVSLLAWVLVAMAAVILLSEKTQLHRRVPLEKSPEALQEKARTIIAKFGYNDPPADSTYGLGSDTEYLRYAETKEPSWLRQLSTSQPASIYFWYRQSPANMIPRAHLAVRASEGDPPGTYPGMATVLLDPKGRMIEFHAVPPQKDESAQAATAPNWSLLFEAAGFNQSDFTSTTSKWVPPFNSDSRAAWEGKLPRLPLPLGEGRGEGLSSRALATPLFPSPSPKGKKGETTQLPFPSTTRESKPQDGCYLIQSAANALSLLSQRDPGRRF